MKKKQTKKSKQKSYTSVQLTIDFWKELKKEKDSNHFDSFENTIKYLIGNK
jgi:hypothetical protein